MIQFTKKINAYCTIYSYIRSIYTVQYWTYNHEITKISIYYDFVILMYIWEISAAGLRIWRFSLQVRARKGFPTLATQRQPKASRRLAQNLSHDDAKTNESKLVSGPTTNFRRHVRQYSLKSNIIQSFHVWSLYNICVYQGLCTGKSTACCTFTLSSATLAACSVKFKAIVKRKVYLYDPRNPSGLQNQSYFFFIDYLWVWVWWHLWYFYTAVGPLWHIINQMKLV